jgi:deoxyribonuclease V
MDVTLHHLHPWDVSPAEAIQIQRRLAGLVHATPLDAEPRTIAGVDVSIRGNRARTAIVVIALPDLEVIDETTREGDVPFPYIPGLLSFREMPCILPALERLRVEPDVFMTDSQGIAHPRRFGLACHLGVTLGRPTFGVAKSRLCGEHREPDPEKGSHSPLIDRGEYIGAVLRTRDRTHPVYVSIGHRITLDEAERLTLACCPRYKIPEPTRLAHRLSYRRPIKTATPSAR